MAKLYETINAGNWRHREGTYAERIANIGCLMNHAQEVYGVCAVELDRIREAVKVLFPKRLGHKSLDRIAQFNDHPDTTVEDVIRVCKVAAV